MSKHLLGRTRQLFDFQLKIYRYDPQLQNGSTHFGFLIHNNFNCLVQVGKGSVDLKISDYQSRINQGSDAEILDRFQSTIDKNC